MLGDLARVLSRQTLGTIRLPDPARLIQPVRVFRCVRWRRGRWLRPPGSRGGTGVSDVSRLAAAWWVGTLRHHRRPTEPCLGSIVWSSASESHRWRVTEAAGSSWASPSQGSRTSAWVSFRR